MAARQILMANLLLIVLLNSSVTVMAGSGLSEDMGTNFAPGISETVDDIVSQARDGFSPGAGAGETLFSLFGAAGSTAALMFQAVTATPTMFLNLGFPEWAVIPLFTPMYILGVFALIYYFTGRAS